MIYDGFVYWVLCAVFCQISEIKVNEARNDLNLGCLKGELIFQFTTRGVCRSKMPVTGRVGYSRTSRIHYTYVYLFRKWK